MQLVLSQERNDSNDDQATEADIMDMLNESDDSEEVDKSVMVETNTGKTVLEQKSEKVVNCEENNSLGKECENEEWYTVSLSYMLHYCF